MLFLPLLLLLLLQSLTLIQAQGAHRKVLLESITTLTLHDHKYTTGRRSAGVPQLKCVGGNACREYTPDVVQCTNTGFDGRDVQWRCDAELPSDLRFGPVEVSCEGFDNPDDSYILVGSCGLEYTLYYREDKKKNNNFYDDQRYFPTGSGPCEYDWAMIVLVSPTAFAITVFHISNNQFDQKSASRLTSNSLQAHTTTNNIAKTFFTVLWIVMFVLIIVSIISTCFARSDPGTPVVRRSGSTGGGWWPGGGGGGGGGPGFGGPGPSYSYTSKPSTMPRTGYTPGFWSGAAFGGLAGYGLGSRNAQRRNPIRWVCFLVFIVYRIMLGLA